MYINRSKTYPRTADPFTVGPAKLKSTSQFKAK